MDKEEESEGIGPLFCAHDLKLGAPPQEVWKVEIAHRASQEGLLSMECFPGNGSYPAERSLIYELIMNSLVVIVFTQ